MKKLAATAVVAWGIVALAGAGGGAYSTTFPLTENPISEGGNWINGKTVGLDWSDFRTAQGLAYGTQTGATRYNDSIAILAGAWPADQTVTATVHTVNQQPGAVYEEVELLLRFSISAHRAAGYEVLFACRRDGGRYVQIVRWNGPLGDFTYLDAQAGPGLANGDRIKATIVGHTIKGYINDVEVVSATDTTFANGSPGMGHYLEGGTGALAGDYGLTGYTASGALAPPRPPANLRIVR